jgi:ubiquitin C-terminal hydrolase
MKGICGLGNLGNTCYMNAALQILSQIDEVNLPLLSLTTLRNIPDSILTYEWIQLYKLIQENHCSIMPHRFLERMRQMSIQKNRQEYSSSEQNDSVEYFAYLIDCMHNSLNLLDTTSCLPRKKSSPSIHRYLDQLESKDCSLLQNAFLYCTVCHYINPHTHKEEFSKIEHEVILALSIPEKNNPTLYDCLHETFKDELMTGENEWFDEKENKKKTVLKKSALCYTPPIFILHLKRWRNNISKKTLKIDTPLLLELNAFTRDEPCTYELFGIINHEGSHRMGHYYSTVKKRNEWYSINDHFIQSISVDQLIHENNYCLFYRKIEK